MKAITETFLALEQTMNEAMQLHNCKLPEDKLFHVLTNMCMWCSKNPSVASESLYDVGTQEAVRTHHGDIKIELCAGIALFVYRLHTEKTPSVTKSNWQVIANAIKTKESQCITVFETVHHHVDTELEKLLRR